MLKSDSEIIVTMDDCRANGFCGSGVTRWLRGHDIDVQILRDKGIPLLTLAELDDAFANRAIAKARERVNG